MTQQKTEQSRTLGDREIREALLERLKNSISSPKAIIQELRVHNGNAIADVVTIHSDAHCYEIKGDADNIRRIEKQGFSYDLAFRKTTVVTTYKHLSNAIKYAPSHWGIIVARERSGIIKLSYVRQASTNPKFDQKIALLTLWRSELSVLASNCTAAKLAKLNREKLASLIAQNLTPNQLFRGISEQLVARNFKQQNSEPYTLYEH